MSSVTTGRNSGHSGISFRVAETIASDIRQKILRGGYSEGPLPKQEDLSAEYKVSGPSVREALRILEAEGLITVRRGKLGGAYVHRPDWSSAAFALAMSLQGQGVRLRDVGDSLVTLEPLCAVACAQREDRRSVVVPLLAANIEQNRAAIGQGSAYTQVAREFHDLIVDATPNETLRLLVRSIVAVWSIQEQTWAYLMQEQGNYPTEAEQRDSLRSHEVLTELIANGHADEVGRYATAHLKATQQVVLDRYGDRIVDASSPSAIHRFKSL